MTTEQPQVEVRARTSLRKRLQAEYLASKDGDRKYLSSFTEINGQALTLEAAGNENRVYSGVIYENRMWYAKVPRRRTRLARAIFQTPKAEKIRQEYALVKRYFDEPMGREVVVETNVLENQNHDYCLLVRPLTKFHHITGIDLMDSRIKAEVQDVLNHNKKMREETGKTLGVLGKEGAITTWGDFFRRVKDGEITNLVIEEATNGHAARVMIVDFGLMDVKRPKDVLSIAANRYLLKRQLDLTFNSQHPLVDPQRYLRRL